MYKTEYYTYGTYNVVYFERLQDALDLLCNGVLFNNLLPVAITYKDKILADTRTIQDLRVDYYNYKYKRDVRNWTKRIEQLL